jgi:hypothetical protein
MVKYDHHGGYAPEDLDGVIFLLFHELDWLAPLRP